MYDSRLVACGTRSDTVVTANEKTTVDHTELSHTDEAVATFVTRDDGTLLIPGHCYARNFAASMIDHRWMTQPSRITHSAIASTK